MQNWFDLPHLCGIRISGSDALEFCQAQFTADLRELTAGRWQVCAWCDPKGRCLATILASVDEDHVDLVVPTSQAELLKRLKMYSIGRQVDFSTPLSAAGARASGNSPGGPVLADGRALRLDEQPAGSSKDSLQNWRIADLCLPLPWLSEHSSGRFLPQFLGMEENQGLSYRKGCYPGQEVIARVHYLGKTKYRLTGFVLTATGQASEMECTQLKIHAGDYQADVLDSFSVDSKLIGLAVCPVDCVSGSEVSAQTPFGLLSGQMTDPKGLCYYQSINDD